MRILRVVWGGHARREEEAGGRDAEARRISFCEASGGIGRRPSSFVRFDNGRRRGSSGIMWWWWGNHRIGRHLRYVGELT